MGSFRVVFMGTPDFAVPILDALIEGPDALVAVVTRPDKPKGRGQRVRPPPVKARAEAAGIEVLQPEAIKGERGAPFRERLAELAPDLAVVAAFGRILPQEILDLPRLGCINVHASLLPRWRGASPVNWAIAAGDAETGVSIMQMDAGLDTGPVFLRRREPIRPDDTGGTLEPRLARIGGEALLDVLDRLRAESAQAERQDEAGATYAPVLKKEDGRLDLDLDAETLERRVRAFQPWPGAFTRLGGKLLKVHRAEARAQESDARPGTVLAAGPDGIDVACGKGVLRLLEVQPEGKRRMAAGDLAAGRRDLVGQTLGEG